MFFTIIIMLARVHINKKTNEHEEKRNRRLLEEGSPIAPRVSTIYGVEV